MVVNNHSNHDLDLSDQLIMKSLRRGLRIEGTNSSTDSIDACTKNGTNHNTDTDSDSEGDSSSPELKQLLQSSVNSAVSTGTQNQNRSSKQSKTSIDVAVQANAKEIATQTAALDSEQRQRLIKK